MDVASTSLGSVLSGARVAKVPLSRLHGYPPRQQADYECPIPRPRDAAPGTHGQTGIA